MRALVLGTFGIAMGAACTGEHVVEVGRLLSEPPPSYPASAQIGVPFEITFHTAGTGCVEHHSTEVELSPDGATIMPFDRRYVPGDNLVVDSSCGKKLVRLEHRAALVFDTAGTKTIVLDGEPTDATFAIDVR